MLLKSELGIWKTAPVQALISCQTRMVNLQWVKRWAQVSGAARQSWQLLGAGLWCSKAELAIAVVGPASSLQVMAVKQR
jgi:hypothetical protein